MNSLKKDTIVKAMEKIREELNELAEKKEISLHEGEILILSQELDKFIYMYYCSEFLI